MSFEQSKFTLMALPQRINETGLLQLHILIIPRNISPLENVDTIYNPAGAMPFATARPVFAVKLLNQSTEFPGRDDTLEVLRSTDPLNYAADIEGVYRTLRDAKNDLGQPKYFDIDETRSSDKPGSTHHVAPPPLSRDTAVRKYLPHSYRNAFNFTSPRVRNAVTDDSYHCAMRDQAPVVKKPLDHKVSWGKVYAHLLRQPALAMAGGLLYKTTVQLQPGDVEKGGWLYVDLENGSDYHTELDTSLQLPNPPLTSPFIKRYAAKIPPLVAGEARDLFTAIAFPVMNPGETPPGTYDELFIEAGRYHHGFATIVHANQPPSQNLLKEETDGLYPQKEAGIRLGWEDEQVLIWYLRQMATAENSTDRADAPLCVMGYHVDVRSAGNDDEIANPWESLNEVTSRGDMMLEGINLGMYQGELPYQVYPTKIDTASDTGYWLPMYFANWNNGSIVIPDDNASRIYKNNADNRHPVNNANPYVPIGNTLTLLYGNSYQFRVRLADISGGGPLKSAPSFDLLSPSHIKNISFKRYVAPDAVRIMNEATAVLQNTDDHNFTGDELQLARPLMGYPGVCYTQGYADPVQRLADASQALLDEQAVNPNGGGRAFGIADPDVVRVRITVEVETLQLDNLASASGREHFITLYTTQREFAAFDENNSDETIAVPIRFIDEPVLLLTNTNIPFSSNDDNACIAAIAGELVLPTARDIRITLQPEGKEAIGYWGIDAGAGTAGTRLGKARQLTTRRESLSEVALFTGINDPQVLQGIFLQPDPLNLSQPAAAKRNLLGTEVKKQPDIVQRLAAQLDVIAKDKSLYAPNGERIHFWCSSRLRHNMAPDSSSLTFANKNELQHQWLVCTTLTINRDWTWDSLDPLSFTVERRSGFSKDGVVIAAKPYRKIGDVELKKTASYQAIQPGKGNLVKRNCTKIIFIDALDGTPDNDGFPDVSEVQYQITPHFRPGHAPAMDSPFETGVLKLPVTTPPAQSPRLIGAGMALSPYVRNAQYSVTEARKRFLWLEFDEAPRDPNDGLFARVLGYAPDQLLSNNNPSLWQLFPDDPINLDPEYIRVITPAMGFDHSGLKAMQPMTKSLDQQRHFYILPLPPGLHFESPELFGFFTYEFRFGHTDRVWSTAQARFGLPLRIAGLQHPAPNLTAMLSRNERSLLVTAPFAQAVFNGQDVSSKPPRTSMWALLYAQVTQADGSDFRNILLMDFVLPALPDVPDAELFRRFMFEQISAIELQRSIDFRDEVAMLPYNLTQLMGEWIAQFQIEKQRMIREATGSMTNREINDLLDLYGLPEDTPMSVVCVEVFGRITNIREQFDQLEFVATTERVHGAQQMVERRIIKNNVLVNSNHNYIEMAGKLQQEYGVQLPATGLVNEQYNKVKVNPVVSPLAQNLGKYRILRTSPLTPVPFVCCTNEKANALGLLSLRGTLRGDFSIPDNTDIDGWIYSKSNCTVRCTGDIDNDGIDEIVFTDAKGMAIVKYQEGSFRLLFSTASNSLLGDWRYDDRTSGVRDWGYTIASFSGEPFKELLLIGRSGLATLKWEGGTLVTTHAFKNGQVFANWKVNTTDRLVGVASLQHSNETNIVFENNVEMHLVSVANPLQSFTLKTGVRYGQWMFSRNDNTIQCFGDFDGDGVAEIFISSPWGIGLLKWRGDVVVSMAMHINGSNLNGYVVSNTHVFGSAGNTFGDSGHELLVHNNNQLQAVLAFSNGLWRGITMPNKQMVLGDLGGDYIGTLDRDGKPDWLFNNNGVVFIVQLDEVVGVQITNIIEMNKDIDAWRLKPTDKFFAAGNFMGRVGEQQLLVVG